MIRLILIILLFLVSLLAVLKAQAYYLWLLAIAVTEFPLVFAGVTILVLLTGFFAQKYQLAGSVIGVVALLLFLSPILRSYLISKNLDQNFSATFGSNEKNIAPFSFAKLFKLSFKDTVPSRTLTYVRYGDTSLTLDFFPANSSSKKSPPTGPKNSGLLRRGDLEGAAAVAPCVIVVHGGSWSSGDSKQLPDLNSYLAKKGYNVASINYRMAPKWQTPAPVEDIKNAIAYLRKNADELRIDTDNFVLLGRSAGAQIALLAAYTLHDKDLKGIIDFYGPADMVWGYSIPSNPLIMDSRGVMDAYVGGPYSRVPEKYAACSPVLFVDRTSPPTLIIHGTNDVLVSDEHSRRLDEKLQQNVIKHFWLKLPWATHGFDFNLNGPGGQLSTYTVERFLNSVTK